MKIGIVNDVDMATHILSSIIREKTPYTVIWTACDGAEAVQKTRESPPDIILMDLLMPVMDGVEATGIIMQENPCPILIVTSSVTGNLNMVFEAMGQGAIDVVKTPSLEVNGGPDTCDELIEKIHRIGVLIGKKQIGKSLIFPGKQAQETPKKHFWVPPLFVVGSSTGGPMAIASILSKLNQDIPFSMVIIQHINHEFVPGLAKWLNDQTSLTVTVAEEGVVPERGVIYLPAKELHLEVTPECTLRYIKTSEFTPFKPSIDIFFHSAAKHWPIPSVGALLTGMGRDGALGLKELQNAGWYTIAEDATTCVVHGMPKAASEIGAATEVLPLDRIPGAVIDWLSKKRRGE